MKVFVLNLERAVERRTRMLAQLQDRSLDAEILPAVDGLQVDRTRLPARTGASLSAGEIGCYLSHRHAWETVLKRGLDHAVILEDDVIVSADLKRVVTEIATLDLPFDAVRLSALKPVRGITVARLSDGSRLVLPNKNPSGAQGYLVSRAGAKRLVAKLAVPEKPVDDAFDEYWKHDLRIPVLHPSLVKEDPSIASTIGYRANSHPQKTLLRHLTRVAEAQRRKLAVFLMARRLRTRGPRPTIGTR